MSKTYTLTATVTGKRGSVRSATLANYTTDYANKFIGSTGSSYQYACIFAFDSVTFGEIRALGADAVESIVLRVHATTGASGDFHTYYGVKKATGTSSAEIASSSTVAVLDGQTDIVIDLTALGISATDAYCIGSQENISGETYATIRGVSATLIVVVKSGDVHIKNNGSVYDGEVWHKSNGQMYRGEVWHKRNGQMYRGS